MSSWLVPLIVGVAGVVGTFVTTRWGKPGTRENALIDQLQEERGENRERITKLEATVDELRAAVSRLLTRDTLWSIHCSQVEAEVTRLGGTPPPRPAELQEAA